MHVCLIDAVVRGVAGNHEGQKWLTDSVNHMRRKHVEFGHAAHHDIIHVGALRSLRMYIARFVLLQLCVLDIQTCNLYMKA